MNDKKMAPKVRGIWLLEFFGKRDLNLIKCILAVWFIRNSVYYYRNRREDGII